MRSWNFAKLAGFSSAKAKITSIGLIWVLQPPRLKVDLSWPLITICQSTEGATTTWPPSSGDSRLISAGGTAAAAVVGGLDDAGAGAACSLGVSSEAGGFAATVAAAKTQP